MKCKKCKKECMESELTNGICEECLTETKSINIKTIIISVAISTIIYICFELWANNPVGLSDFKIDSFNMDTETNSYSTTSSASYSGKGVISCKDSNTDYLVLLKQIDKTTNKEGYNYTIIHNGKGEFSTYDSTYSGATQKPEYEFEVIGYRSFKNNP